jgi:hypothetical protein
MVEPWVVRYHWMLEPVILAEHQFLTRTRLEVAIKKTKAEGCRRLMVSCGVTNRSQYRKGLKNWQESDRSDILLWRWGVSVNSDR